MSNILQNIHRVAFNLFRKNPNKLKRAVGEIHIVTMSAAEKSGEALQRLREFGYAFNENGELRKLDEETGKVGDEPFEFEISSDHAKNQSHYEQLANQIPDIVYDLLEQNGLKRTFIPNKIPVEESSFFFSQPQELKNSKKLIVLIHGSGCVRAGQWARSLIINNSLNHGTQIPYIKKAQALDYDIVVTNTNDIERIVKGKRQLIPEISSPLTHASYIWNNYILPSQPEAVAIIAHSYGGTIVQHLAKSYPEFFKNKVFAIALTDSAHYGPSQEIMKIIGNTTCNWVRSSSPLDTKVSSTKSDIKCVSAGHVKHEWTSYTAMDSVFKYIEDKYEKFIEKK